MKKIWPGVALVGVLASCGHPSPQKDLPNEKVTLNTDQRIDYVNPDKFPNVIAFCDGTTRIYVTTREAGVNMIAIRDSRECGSN